MNTKKEKKEKRKKRKLLLPSKAKYFSKFKLKLNKSDINDFEGFSVKEESDWELSHLDVKRFGKKERKNSAKKKECYKRLKGERIVKDLLKVKRK